MVTTVPAAPGTLLPASNAGLVDRRPRLWLSALILTGILGAIALAIGGGPGFTVDEVALLSQVNSLESGSWMTPHPHPSVDPDLVAYPNHLAVRTDGGFSAYSKHPLVPLVLLWSRSVAGGFGPWLVVLIGHVAAATAIARVIRLVVPRWETAGFWLAGLGSPLVLHALVLWMHSWGIALAALATERALTVVQDESRGRLRLDRVAAVLVAVAALPLVRTEGALFGVALAGALGLDALRRRCPQVLCVAGLVVGTTMAVVLLEAAWVRAVVGEYRDVGENPSAHLSWIQQRGSAVVSNLLTAGSRPGTVIAITISSTLVILAAWSSRRGVRGVKVWALAGVGAALHVAALHVPSATPVPGLVHGAPLLVVPLVMVRPARHPAERILVPLIGLYLLGVALTAYATGGGADWAGRYSSLGTPALAALAAVRLDAQRRLIGPRDARVLLGALLAMTVAAGPAVIRYVGESVDTLSAQRAAIDERVAQVAPDPVVHRPVAITEDPRLGRVLELAADRVAGLRAETSRELVPLLERLRAAGSVEVLLVRYAPVTPTDVAAIEGAGWSVRTSVDDPAGVRFVVLSTS